MPVHCLFVESVDLGRFSLSARSHDLFRDYVYLAAVAACQKHSRTFPCKRSGNGAADPAAASVDHRVLILMQHGNCPFLSRTVRPLLALVRSSALLHVVSGAGALLRAASFNINLAFCL